MPLQDLTSGPLPEEDRDPSVGGGSPLQPGHGRAGSSLTKDSRIWASILGAGLLAGVISWGLGEATYGIVHRDDASDVGRKYASEMQGMGPYDKSDFITKKMRGARMTSESGNSAIAFGGPGAILGLALGVAGGLARGSGASARRGGLVGLLLGGVAGALTSFLAVPLYFKNLDAQSGLTVPLLTHGTILVACGAAAGAAFAIGLARRGSILGGVVGGALGAGIAALGYELINAMAFPLEQEPDPLSTERIARLLLHLGTALLVAIFAAVGLSTQPVNHRGRPA